MKFSLIAAASALAMAATSEAAWAKLWSQEQNTGTCKQFELNSYGTCYDVSAFGSVKSSGFVSTDPYNNKITITFFETANCGGKWTRASGNWPAGSWQYWPWLDYVSGNIKSVWITNLIETNGNGSDNIYRPSTKAAFKSC
jgi:hypothetical protein